MASGKREITSILRWGYCFDDFSDQARRLDISCSVIALLTIASWGAAQQVTATGQVELSPTEAGEARTVPKLWYG